MTSGRRKRHNPEQIVRKLRDADAMLNAGKELSAVLQALEVGESTSLAKPIRRNEVRGSGALKKLEDENPGLKQLVADLSQDNQMLKYDAEGNFWTFRGSVRRP